MSRLKIFAKGNLDVRDSLHSLWCEHELQWNGINEILRERHPGVQAHVRHETLVRSDALLETTGAIPEGLLSRNFSLGAHSIAMQFSDALFRTDADAIVLSLQADVQIPVVRHRRHNYVLYPNHWSSWRSEDQAWLRTEFVTGNVLNHDTSMANFTGIVERIRANTQAPILIYNMSSVVPGDNVHAYDGMEDTLTTRIRRFNLGLTDLSKATGISIVDVDTIVARQGADLLKFDTTHLSREGCRAVAGEVVRILDDVGCLS